MTKPRTTALKIGPLRVAPHVRDGEPTGRWLIDLPPHLAPNGKRQRLFFDGKKAATDEARRLLRDLQLEGAIRGYGPKLAYITFSELSKRWLDHQSDRVETGKKRQSSLESDAARLTHLLTFFGSMDIQRIASEDLLAFQKNAIKLRSPTTVNAQTRLLKTILIYAADKDLIAKVPKVEALREPRKHVELPTMQEVRTVLTHMRPRTALLVRFLAETGCRKGEAFNLEWTDLRPAQSLVIIRRKDGWETKTEHSQRTFPISRSLMAALMDSKAAAEQEAAAEDRPAPHLVFLGRGAGRVWDFRKTLATAITRSGITRDGAAMHLTPHMLRKCFITWQKMRGVDDALLQPVVGHVPGSPVTARHYMHLPTEALRGAVLDLATAAMEETTGAASVFLHDPKLATSGNAE